VTHRIAAALTLIIFGVANAADAPRSYQEAEAIWVKTRDTVEYQTYAAEFAQYSNALGLDERNGCYSVAPVGAVTLMLLIDRAQSEEFARIEHVFYDPDNARARCFEHSYMGIATKIPPFVPFVLQLRME
jgi:hypothetical protein